MILDRIESPNDLKELNISELNELKKEIRKLILTKVSKVGGHLGSNLGSVELEIALHYVFNSPKDKIVFDVSHQSYTHKILTGRKEAFLNKKAYDDVTGFTSKTESPHDMFTVGHTSTSISLAYGLAKARDIKGTKENIIAFIGDGSMSGGEAFEGLNNAGTLKSNFIVIFNDNQMSIANNSGSLYDNLEELRNTKGKSKNNFFKALGFDYKYISKGNDVKTLIEVLEEVKDIDHPIVLHINTIKGLGYKKAVEAKDQYHSRMPFNLKTGESTLPSKPSYSGLIRNYLIKNLDTHKDLALLSAAAPFFYGNKETIEKYKDRILDLGIAEESLFSVSAGLSHEGLRPVVSIFSFFIGRAIDQLLIDASLNKENTLILIHGGTFSEDAKGSTKSATHHGIYDSALISNIPGLLYIHPTNEKELFKIMDDYIKGRLNGVIALRVPTVRVETVNETLSKNYLDIKSKVINNGSKVALLGLGNFYFKAEEVYYALEKLGIKATLINPLFSNVLDIELLESLKANHSLVVTFEDEILDGGFGEKVARFYSSSDMKVINYGFKKDFYDYVSIEDTLKDNHLTLKQVVKDIKQTLK